MLKWLWVSVAVLVADQITKQVADSLLHYGEPVAILPFFNLTLLYNKGAAFSFLSDAGGWQRWFFTLLAIGVSIGLTVWLTRLNARERLTAMGLTLVLGGAVGNLIDRLWYGHVIDFLDFHAAGWHWPAFNIADSAITIGVGLLLWDSFRRPAPVRPVD